MTDRHRPEPGTLTVFVMDVAPPAPIDDLLKAGLQTLTADADRAADVVLADADGLEAVRASGDRRPVVVIIDAVDRRRITSLLVDGADGFVLSTTAAGALGDALRAVVKGFTVVPRAARDALKHPVLTSRQQQIVALLVMGLSNGEIASRLYVSESTVKTHLSAIFARLGVKSRKEAVDVVLDPSSSLGAGILGLRTGSAARPGYGPPTVTSPDPADAD